MSNVFVTQPHRPVLQKIHLSIVHSVTVEYRINNYLKKNTLFMTTNKDILIVFIKL